MHQRGGVMLSEQKVLRSTNLLKEITYMDTSNIGHKDIFFWCSNIIFQTAKQKNKAIKNEFFESRVFESEPKRKLVEIKRWCGFTP